MHFEKLYSPEGNCIAAKDKKVDNPKVYPKCHAFLGSRLFSPSKLLIVPVYKMTTFTKYDILPCRENLCLILYTVLQNSFLPLIIAELDRRLIELKINKTLQKVL